MNRVLNSLKTKTMKTIISLLLVIALVSCKKANTSPTNNSNNNATNNTTNNSNSNVNDTCWVNYENIQNATSVEIDKNDTKWFVTEGLYSFDSKWSFYSSTNAFFNKLKINPINSEKTLFFNMIGGSFLTTFNGTFNVQDSINQAPSRVFALEFDDKGNMWVINGVGEFNNTTAKLINLNNSNVSYNFYSSTFANEMKFNNNYLWISLWYSGLAKFDISENKITETFNQSNSMIGSNQIVDMVFDNLGNLWVASEDGGISKYDGKIWENFNSVNSGLLANKTTSIAVDKFNNIWVGTGKGLSKYNNSIWTNYTTSNSKILDNGVFDIAVDKQDNKWIVTKEGVSKLSKTKTN